MEHAGGSTVHLSVARGSTAEGRTKPSCRGKRGAHQSCRRIHLKQTHVTSGAEHTKLIEVQLIISRWREAPPPRGGPSQAAEGLAKPSCRGKVMHTKRVDAYICRTTERLAGGEGLNPPGFTAQRRQDPAEG